VKLSPKEKAKGIKTKVRKRRKAGRIIHLWRLSPTALEKLFLTFASFIVGFLYYALAAV
jgi:hypothetical protein